MIPVCLLDNDITKTEMIVFGKVKKIVEDLPNDLTCHQVCAEIVAKIPELVHVKGRFNRFDHSWLCFKYSKTIIDPYPWCVGSGPIILAIVGTLNPWIHLYNPEHGDEHDIRRLPEGEENCNEEDASSILQ